MTANFIMEVLWSGFSPLTITKAETQYPEELFGLLNQMSQIYSLKADLISKSPSNWLVPQASLASM